MKKNIVLILGKLPPPYMGPAIATQIILNSSLRNHFELLHVDTKANQTLDDLGKWSLGKIFRNLAIYFRLLGTIIRHRPALVLIPISQTSTGFIKDFFLIAISKITFRKVLVQLRGSSFLDWLSKTSPFMRWFVRGSLKTTQGVIVLGNNLRHLFRGIFPEGRIFVVPNGGNYPLAFTVKRNDPVRVLYLANLQSSKGIEDVLQSTAILAEKNMNHFHLDVVGEWRSESTRAFCTALVKDKKLPVSFHPASSGNEKMNYLKHADIFVFTPRMPEGHPWVIVEAMAAGLPVISTDQGAIIESVRDGENGYIVPANSPEAIAARLAKLIPDSALREKMGRAGRSLYEENFTEDKMVDRLRDTFMTVIENRKH